MKTYLALCCLVLSTNAFCQSLDSLKQSITRLEIQQTQIKLNLERHSNQFSLGTTLLVGGIAMGAVDFAMRDKDKDTGYTFTVLAGVVFSAGVVLQIDSHKWIGRSGKRRKF